METNVDGNVLVIAYNECVQKCTQIISLLCLHSQSATALSFVKHLCNEFDPFHHNTKYHNQENTYWHGCRNHDQVHAVKTKQLENCIESLCFSKFKQHIVNHGPVKYIK